MENLKTINEKYLDILDNLEWKICGYTNDGRVELEKYSPAGEDFIICVNAENLPESVAEYAEDFDIDEHIEMWAEAKRNDDCWLRGIPPIRELVKDAEDIKDMLDELAMALNCK